MEILVGFLLGTSGSDNAFGSVFKRGEVGGSVFFRGELCYRTTSEAADNYGVAAHPKDHRTQLAHYLLGLYYPLNLPFGKARERWGRKRPLVL